MRLSELFNNSKTNQQDSKAPNDGHIGPPDLWIAGIAFVLVVIGLVMVYSASSPIALKKFDDPAHYALRNGFFALLGTMVLAYVSKMPIPTIQQLGRIGFWVSLLMLALVLIPGVGIEGGGARRWINFRFTTMQPSELFKVTLVLFLAHLMTLQPERVTRFKGGLAPILILYIIAASLLMNEPDFGTTLITGSVVLGMVFVAGIPFGWIATLILAAVPAAAIGVLMAPYRVQRITSFLDPWDDPLGSDFQLVQSLLAFGNGGISGTGLGEGQQKQFYLPESHTDFILAVIGEELGLFVVLLIIGLFALLTWRAFRIARFSNNRFAQLSSAGFAILIGTQSLANMGVVMGLLPPKGLTLPLVSYGGSSLIITMLIVGLLLSFSRTVPVAGSIDPELKEAKKRTKPKAESDKVRSMLKKGDGH
ncbi:MAG: putative lipid II flippase FtsW [Magnetococcales bacterium]|nr:putative lipid II flippase FtsW [Magnetococcales bacterium]